MCAHATLHLGRNGTKQLLAQYGDQLVCVRYRDDETGQRRLKTVELIVEETLWRPARATSKDAAIVGVRIRLQEVSLQRQVKLTGGRWSLVRRV